VIFTFQSDSAQYIYHYTSAEIAISKVIGEGKLKFGSYVNTNDPKETKDWVFIAGTNEGRDLLKYTPEYLAATMNPRIKETTNVLCFTSDQKLSGNLIHDMPKRGFCMPRMWAQYADKHRGVCLLFDFKILSDVIHELLKNRTYFCDYVTYRDRDIAEIQMDQAFIVNVDYLERLGADEYAYSHSQKFTKRMFFEKASDWRDENEFRWVVFNCDGEFLVDYKEALKGVVFGADCSEDDISKIANASKGKSMEFQRLKWRNCAPWFDFGRTEWI